MGLTTATFPELECQDTANWSLASVIGTSYKGRRISDARATGAEMSAHKGSEVLRMNSKLPTWRPSAKEIAVTVVLIYAGIVAGTLYYSAIHVTADALVTLLGIVGSGLFGIILAWFVNSFLARDLEKRKKKYDIKYESYSQVYRSLESFVQLARVWHLHSMVSNRLEGKEKSGDVQAHTDSYDLIMTYLSELEVLRATLGGELQEGLIKELSDRSLMGVPFDKVEDLDEKEWRARFERSMHEHLAFMMKWWILILRDLDRNLNHVKLIGFPEVGEKVGEYIRLLMFQMFQLEAFKAGRDAIISDMEKKDIGLSRLANNIEYRLMNDLDNTL
jgi:hypothetical protein